MSKEKAPDITLEQNEQTEKLITVSEKQLDALIETKIAEIQAKLEAEVKAKAKEGTKSVPADEAAARKAEQSAYLNERVIVQLFKDGREYKDDVFVAVNGETCRIQRGKPVAIKRKFALVLDQRQIQDIKAAEYSQEKEAEFQAAVAAGRL